MSLWKKASDWFTGQHDPLGNGNKSIPNTDHTTTHTQGHVDSLLTQPDTKTSTPIQKPQAQVAPAGIPPSQAISHATQTQVKRAVSLDVLDLTRVIDIYAESQAVQAFDAEMREKKGVGFFGKIGGFFKRSLQRVGRDAWIDSEKRRMITEIKTGLKNGNYTEDFLREHVSAGDQGIVHGAHLRHEEITIEEKLPALIQSTVDAWLAATPGSPERTQKTTELKATIEANYPTVTADMYQLEQSLIRLEQAKVSSEVDTIEAKLNILDIGRIEQGNGQRKEGWFIRIADTIATGINNSKLPNWIKQKLIGAVRHPNTAAVLTAMGTRAGVGVIAGATVAAGFSGGFLLPVLAGSTAGGLFAAVRARREMRDRTAEIDRRGARGEETGSMSVDGESSNISHQTNAWQHPVMDLYNRLAAARDSQEKEDALIAGISYLVKHKVGREKSINMLQYDVDKSVSKQHVEMIRLMNEIFPGVVARFNDGSLFENSDNSEEAQHARTLYTEITDLADRTMRTRMSEESKYARAQGFKFGATAAIVGGTVGATIHGILSGINGTYVSTHTPGTTTTGYPGGLQSYTNVQREFWYDNGTPTPRFDHTEIMIHTDKNGGWNVSHMLSKTATTLHHGNHTITASDFTSGKIQAVITPKSGGPSFVLPIDAKGNIQIPQGMQDAFNTKNFAFLEVGEVQMNGTQINLNPIATVKGAGSMVFDPIITKTPGVDNREFVWGDAPWVGIPVGGNRYHELQKTQGKKPIGIFIDRTPPKDEEPHGGEPDGDGSPDDNKPEGKPVTPVPTPAPKPGNDKSGNEDPTGLWEDIPQGEKKDDLTAEKADLDDLWNEIVKIRQTLEGRKIGKNALSDTGVENMKDTESKLLDVYIHRKKEWNTKVQIAANTTLPDDQKKTYRERIQNLIDTDVLATKNGKPMMLNWYGRIIVAIKTKNGGIIPFYRSSSGTDGKKAGAWFPCFGITDNDSWLIKGSLEGLNSGHGTKELKNIQNTLNTFFDWDNNLDNEYSKVPNPLMQAGAIIGNDWIRTEERKQTSQKPQSHTDGLADAWIKEWVSRVTRVSKTTIKLNVAKSIPPVQMPLDVQGVENDTQLDESFATATRILGNFIEPRDEVLENGSMSPLRNDPNYILRGQEHRQAINDLFGKAKNAGGKNAMKVISSFYGKNGKIWLSKKTSIGQNSTHQGNIFIGLKESGNNGTSYMSRRLYEISEVQPIPQNETIVLFHELGHQITLKHMIQSNTPEMNALIDETRELKAEQGAGFTPLSSMPFYENRAQENTENNTQFWEDMAELMGLYIMGREYVERYLDDRIQVRRDMKATISEGLKDRIMSVLDMAYQSYIQ